MKTTKEMNKEIELINKLNQLPLYEFIMNSFNIVISPKFWAEKNGIEADEALMRRIALNEIKSEFGDELSEANSRAEKALKKACNYVDGMYEVIRLRLMLFITLSSSEREHIVSLLCSDLENKRFGGLRRALKLCPEQAEALLPVSKEIGYFLSERYNLGKEILFPEEEITSLLEQANDAKLSRVLGLIESGYPNCFYGALKELGLSNKNKLKACLEEGADPIIALINMEILKRENASLLSELKTAKENLIKVRETLEADGFEHSEIEKMLKCTNAYEHFIDVKSRLTPDLAAIA